MLYFLAFSTCWLDAGEPIQGRYLRWLLSYSLSDSVLALLRKEITECVAGVSGIRPLSVETATSTRLVQAALHVPGEVELGHSSVTGFPSGAFHQVTLNLASRSIEVIGQDCIITAPNLGWNTEILDLDALLPDAPLGTTLFNEANAAALAELRYRPAGNTDFLFVSGEVGVGGGVVIGSELFTGPQGHAGELGHVVVRPGGARCSCGGTGCLETVAGQDAIFVAAGVSSSALSEDRDTRQAPAGATVYRSGSERLAQLKSALLEGDAKALAAATAAGHSLGIALASTLRILNISSVVLSGHFAVLGNWIRPALLDSLEEYAPGCRTTRHRFFHRGGNRGNRGCRGECGPVDRGRATPLGKPIACGTSKTKAKPRPNGFPGLVTR